MRLRIKVQVYLAIVIGVAFVVAAFLFSYSAATNEEGQEIHQSISISSTESDNSIFQDIAIDNDQSIHLVWQNDEKGLEYKKSRDRGRTWSDPIILSNDLVSGRSIHSRIFTKDDRISVFWFSRGLNLQESMDGGATWSSTRNVISDIPMNHFSLHPEGDFIYLVYNNREGTFISQSEDLGSHWESPQRIAPYIGTSSVISIPSMTVSDGVIHVIWSQLDSRQVNPGGMLKGKLFYVRSYNFGEKWEDFRELNINRGRTDHDLVYSILYPSITASGGSLLIAFEESGFSILMSTDDGTTWSSRTTLTEIPVLNIALCQTKDEGTHIFWIDKRHQKREWWSYVPLHEMFTWDKSPYWVNNDLYYAFTKDGISYNTQRLTMPLSYVQTHQDAISCGVIGDSIAVFWSGKRKVGKSLSQYKMPTEIFYRLLDTGH